MIEMRRFIFIMCLPLAACTDFNSFLRAQNLPMIPIAEIKAGLNFSCVHEVIPSAPADSDVLFQYARWLQKNNQLKRDERVNLEIERLYRISAENGHFKANINLQVGGMRGEFGVLEQEYLRLSQELIDVDVATGYYLVSLMLEKGTAGLQQDSDMALRYLNKAANEGHASAQFFIAEKLEPTNVAPVVAWQMFRCAAEQGHGEAAIALGIHLKYEKRYEEAVKVLQKGVAAGDENAAGRLEDAFRGPGPEHKLDYLALEQDLERADRYEKIWRILHNYSYANPKVPEINDIVPLPPAKLPEWDGKLKWLEEREANIPPPKPCEELINKLADAAKLERATGRPMPGAKGFSQAHLSVPYECKTFGGDICPVSGYWKVDTHWRLGTPDGKPIIRYFAKGQKFPAEQMLHEKKRRWPLSPQWVKVLVNVRWYLV